MDGRNRGNIYHPWIYCDVIKEPARVAVHEVGGVYHVEVGSKEGTESNIEFLEYVT